MNEKNEIDLAFQILIPEKLRAARAWLHWSLNEAHKQTKIPRTYISQAELGRRILTDTEKQAFYTIYKAHGALITAQGVEGAN